MQKIQSCRMSYKSHVCIRQPYINSKSNKDRGTAYTEADWYYDFNSSITTFINISFKKTENNHIHFKFNKIVLIKFAFIFILTIYSCQLALFSYLYK